MGDEGSTDGGAGWLSLLKSLFGGGGDNASQMAGTADPNIVKTYFGDPTISAPPVADDSQGSFSSIIDPKTQPPVDTSKIDNSTQSTNQLMQSLTGGAYDPSAPAADTKTAPSLGQVATAAAKKFSASADTLAKLAIKPPQIASFQAPSGGTGDSSKLVTPNGLGLPAFTPGQRLTLSQLIYGR